MTGIMHLSFSKSVETGTGVSEEQWEQANHEKEAQPRLDPPESKPPDQLLQGVGETSKEADPRESPTQVSNPKSAENTFCLMMPKEIRPEPHIQPDPGKCLQPFSISKTHEFSNVAGRIGLNLKLSNKKIRSEITISVEKAPHDELDHEFNPEPNNKWKSKTEQGYSHAMSTPKLSAILNQHIPLVFLTVLLHLSWLKEVEKGIAEQKRRLQAHKALTCHTKKEYEQHVLEPIAAADLSSKKISFQVDSLLSILHSTQVSEVQNLIYYWDHFMIHQKLQNYVFEIPISSIMHLFFSLSVNKGAGLMEKHKDLEGAAIRNNTFSSHVPIIPNSFIIPCLSSLFTRGRAALIRNQEEWLACSNPIPEKPADSNQKSPKQQTQGKYLNSQRRMKPNLLSFGAGKTVLRTKLFEEGGDDMIMASANDKEQGPQLEPDGAKDMELEPDGIKDLKLEPEDGKLVAEDELVAEEALAAPMVPVTHSRVMLEPRWRRYDPKPPWFLIKAQDISKWACVSFALFFPYLWFCPTGFSKGRFLMRLMIHIQITHFADQDPGPTSGKTKNVAMKNKGHICVQTLL